MALRMRSILAYVEGLRDLSQLDAYKRSICENYRACGIIAERDYAETLSDDHSWSSQKLVCIFV